MIDQFTLHQMCKHYNIKYQVFESTNIILLDTGLDQYQIKIEPNRDKPYCLMHKNKLRQTNKYHFQRRLTNLFQTIDCVATHKKILSSIYGSSPIHKQKNKINKYNDKRKHNKKKGISC